MLLKCNILTFRVTLKWTNMKSIRIFMNVASVFVIIIKIDAIVYEYSIV